MNTYEEKLRKFIAENQIQAEHLSFNQSCHSVAEAVQAANASPKDIVKSICLLDQAGNLITAIVKGEDRASTPRIARLLEREAVRMATPEEVLEKTGYPCGGTPSFGYDSTFLIDPKVLEREMVFTGGGSETSLVKIAPTELLRTNQGSVVRIRS